MQRSTFLRLKQLHDKYGPGVFGKIAQKLLALAFYDAGFLHVVERGVQGVDIDVAGKEGKAFSLEVKTTDKESIPLSKENIDALKDRAKDGYTPVLVVLRMKMFEDWIFANIPLGELRSGSLAISRLRSYKMEELESLIRSVFDNVIDQHFTNVLAHGEHYLIQELERRRDAQAHK